MNIRAYEPRDLERLVDACIRTANVGGDATGMLEHDRLWVEIYLLPYLERHPELAFVVTDDDDRAIGYIVGASDTDAFDAWFRATWWPLRRAAYGGSANPRERELVASADARGSQPSPYQATHPAHLHIDLLPEAQGQGVGRILIGRLGDALAQAGIPGVHAVASASNPGAVAFYPRLGFEALEADPGARAFGLALEQKGATS